MGFGGTYGSAARMMLNGVRSPRLNACQRGCGTCGAATSDDVVPPCAAAEGRAKGMSWTDCLAGLLLDGSSAVQISYYRVVSGGGTMSR
jgi:hypothetical protein